MLLQAQRQDKPHVVKIISESFRNIPHVRRIIKADAKIDQRMEALASYAFEVGMRRNSVYLTKDKLGLVILFPSNQAKKSLYELFLLARMAIKAITIPRILKVSRMESMIKKMRPKQEYLLIWFFGVADESRGSENARQLTKFMFEQSEKLQLDIVAETSIPKNHLVYKRFGFKDFDTYVSNEGFKIWFMKRPYEARIITTAARDLEQNQG